MRPQLVLVLTLTAGLLALGGCRREMAATPVPEVEPGPVSLAVYVPSGMIVPFHKALDLFEAANPNVTVQATYEDDARLLGKVIDGGERPDVFVSPGGHELAVLSSLGLVDASAVVRMGGYRVVAVVRRDWAGSLGYPEDLAGDAVASIALPDPERSSVAHAVRQALSDVGVWDAVSPKVHLVGSISDAYEAVLKGSVDVAFTYRSCPLPRDPEELARSKVRIALELPTESYDEPQVAIGALTSSASPGAASRLVSFLASEATVGMMVAEGLPDERGELLTALPVESSAAPAAMSGDPSQPLSVVAFLPDDDRHREVRAFLATLGSRYEGRVSVALHDYLNPSGDPEGFLAWRNSGLGCSGIVVDGCSKFTVGEGSERRQVAFERKMGVEWDQTELLAAIDQVLARRQVTRGR